MTRKHAAYHAIASDRISEVRMIEDIENVDAKLKTQLFAEVECTT